jgi:hypothetical protein
MFHTAEETWGGDDEIAAIVYCNDRYASMLPWLKSRPRLNSVCSTNCKSAEALAHRRT